jgi:hypothetical protein
MEQTKLNTKKEFIACRLNDTGNCPFLGSVLLGKQKNEPRFGMEYQYELNPGQSPVKSPARVWELNEHDGERTGKNP